MWINVIQEYSRSNHVLFFVPAWYGTDRTWANSYPWYWMRESIEFDDTINQVRIFQEAEMDRILLLPQYSPQLRYFFTPPRFVETDVLSIFLIRSNRFRLIWLCAQFSFRTSNGRVRPLFLYSLFWWWHFERATTLKNWYGSGWKPSLWPVIRMTRSATSRT